MTARVCPIFDGLFTAPYFEGLRAVFSPRHLRFSLEGFPEFEPRSQWYQGHDLAFIVEETGLKVFVDPHDSPHLSPIALAWCDVYGKISFDPETVPPDHAAKVVPLGPSFPTRTLSLAGTAWRATINYLLARRRIDDPRAHFAHWRRQYEFRLPADAYTPGPCDANYAFFSAALWGDGERGNHDRKLFIDACRSLDWLRFEGGFDKAVNTPKLPGYMMPFDRSHSEYLNKVKRSTVVFNSPARLDCHGWKLAEFLALGKAIISTPQVRQMPAPLEHGRHVHFVERSVESIREAIVLLCRDAAYRSRLEQGARAYYEQHLQPRRAIERLLERGRALSESARARPAGVQASACPAPASRQAGPKEASPSRLGLGTVTSPR